MYHNRTKLTIDGIRSCHTRPNSVSFAHGLGHFTLEHSLLSITCPKRCRTLPRDLLALPVLLVRTLWIKRMFGNVAMLSERDWPNSICAFCTVRPFFESSQSPLLMVFGQVALTTCLRHFLGFLPDLKSIQQHCLSFREICVDFQMFAPRAFQIWQFNQPRAQSISYLAYALVITKERYIADFCQRTIYSRYQTMLF